ncbi:uncharacterized protein LOC141632694 [Silene latifolia]|uniref:uncharacterized protein LOC141632694 n=1 Tax=Silene latifolia TaxID=37657 RepID=UPI003D76D01F
MATPCSKDSVDGSIVENGGFLEEDSFTQPRIPGTVNDLIASAIAVAGIASSTPLPPTDSSLVHNIVVSQSSDSSQQIDTTEVIIPLENSDTVVNNSVSPSVVNNTDKGPNDTDKGPNDTDKGPTESVTVNNVSAKPKNWASIVNNTKQQGMDLFLCEHIKDSDTVDLEESDFADELKLWENTLMGHIVGSKPSLAVVQRFVLKYWGKFAKPVVQYFRKGWFSFRFSNSEEMNAVLKNGPWKIGSNSLVLKHWSPMFSCEMETISKVPVWVLFPGLDPFLWSDVVLSKIASKLGRPLFADPATTTKAKLSFARVLIEIDVSKPLFDTFSLLDDQDSLVEDNLVVMDVGLGGTSVANPKPGALITPKNSEVRSYIRETKVDVIALLETRVKQHKAQNILKNYFGNWHKVSISVTQMEAQVISGLVHHFETNTDINLSVVYPEEKLSPNPPLLEMLDFNSCVSDCHLDDISSSGCDMTWTNKHDPDSRVWSKLDRVLVNPSWISSFPGSHAVFHEAGVSDHSPVLLKSVKHALTKLHSKDYSNISFRVQEAKVQLLSCQQKLQLDPFSAVLIHEEKKWMQEFTKFKKAELNILQQRAKLKNIQLSDSSSKYFFDKISERQHHQVLGAICDQYGVLQQGQDNVGTAFQNYYRNLLGEAKCVDNFHALPIPNGPKISEDDSTGLTQVVSPHEIKAAVFSMDSNSSPGVDGFSAGFFKSAWSVVGGDFCKAVQSFFKTGKMSKQANSTILSLISKKDVPRTVMDFRPISCCTLFIKSLAKF